MVCRVSPSFVRFGSFQLPAMRGGDQLPLVRELADYVIRHHYPHLQGARLCPAFCMPLGLTPPVPLDPYKFGGLSQA